MVAMKAQQNRREGGDRVLVTRPAPDAASFAAALRLRGMTPILSPVMRLDFNRPPPPLDGVSAIAFTSANGVRAMAPLAERASRMPVFAVGEMTAVAARQAGYSAVERANGDVTSLIELIVARHDRAGAVLHPVGRDMAGDLADALGARGIKARKAILYEAKPIAALSAEARMALREGPLVWVTLFSPRSARLFLDQVSCAGLTSALKMASAACLSQSVAAAAGAATWGALRVAPDQTANGLISVMCRD